MRRFAALLGAVAMLGAFTGPALASAPPGPGGMGLSITSAVIVARGAGVALGIDAMCQPINGVTELAVGPASGGSAAVTQVSGRVVVSASTYNLLGYNAPITCDGTTVNHFAATLTLPAGSPPFKVGSALVDVTLSANDPNNYLGGNDYADTGQIPMRLTSH